MYICCWGVIMQVKWEYFDYSANHPRESNVYSNRNQGILLVLGFVPGLKIDAVPLFHPHKVAAWHGRNSFSSSFIR